MATALSPVSYRMTPRAPVPDPREDRQRERDEAAKRQRDQLANPEDVKISTEVNPHQGEAYDDMRDFAGSLADRSAKGIELAMQRQRDVGASRGADAAARAGARGAAPDSGAAGLVQQRNADITAREVQDTNTKLTDIALQREQDAREAVVGSADDIADNQSEMYRNQADQWGNVQRTNLDRARLYRDLDNDQYDRTRRTFEMALDDEGDYAPGPGEPGYVGGLRPREDPYGPIGGSLGGSRGRTNSGNPLGPSNARTSRTRSTRRTTRGGGSSEIRTANPNTTYSDFGPGHPYAGGVR